jgi:hypothetical protein
MSKGILFPEDREITISVQPDGCTRNVILAAANLLLAAVTDELECDRVSRGRKKELREIQQFVKEKIYASHGRPTWLVRFLSNEGRNARLEGRKAQIMPFKREPDLPINDDAAK